MYDPFFLSKHQLCLHCTAKFSLRWKWVVKYVNFSTLTICNPFCIRSRFLAIIRIESFAKFNTSNFLHFKMNEPGDHSPSNTSNTSINSNNSNDGNLANGEAQQMLNQFWPNALDDLTNLQPNHDFKNQELPLARIKRIMKLDDDAAMMVCTRLFHAMCLQKLILIVFT